MILRRCGCFKEQPTDAIAALDPYRWAAERHEPALGNDAMSFGTTAWRNLTNHGASEFASRPGMDAQIEDNSLAVLANGYIPRLHSL